MIREPAQVRATTYETVASDLAQQKEKKQTEAKASGETNYSKNCTCSQRRITQTAPMTDSPMSEESITKETPTTTTTTTIPIVINTHPHPRIILIKVPSSSNNNKSNRAEQTAPRTRLIRIPFLPGPVSTPSPVKRTTPQTSSSVNSTIAATAYRLGTASSTPGMTIYNKQQSSAMSHPVAIDQTFGPPTATEMVTETVQVSRMPQTLASMAGIQLTGADEQSSHQDVSGAMPTATVEEIDVPVFIDEYLQDIEATSSTSSSSGSDKGKETFTETDILDFDFDINLITEDHIEQKKMDQCNLDMESSDNINNDYLPTSIEDLAELSSLGEDEICDMGAMRGIDFYQQPSSLDLDIDNIMINSQNPMLCSSQSQSSIIPSYSQTKYFTEQPLLADENSNEGGGIYVCSQESLGFGHLGVDFGANMEPEQNENVAEVLQNILNSVGGSTALKRSATLEPETQPQKRSKLILNLTTSSPLLDRSDVIGTPQIINDVLSWETNVQSVGRPITPNASTHDKIIEDLRSAEEETTNDFSAPNTPYSASSSSTAAPTCQTGFAGFITAPASPAVSIASTSQFTTTDTSVSGNKRKRGRPAKEHADGPDPELMSRMTDDEVKAYKDRIKNNEASRISRRKTRTREMLEKQEEDTLVSENNRLKAQLKRSEEKTSQFKDYLMNRHHHNSTFVKQERD
ncbi:uncharacterized protein Xrp1 [Drosophila tropicalis]|uniref:uncharacterized protein Xrp1 n=1 Tax=Drosophila tropicalis TaxID=46794 RepID=UPI0035AB8CF2